MGRNPKKAVVEGSSLDKILERHMFDAVRRSVKPFDLGNYKVKSESQAACVKSLARLAPLLTDLYKSVPKGEIIKASCVKNGLLRLLQKHPQAHTQQENIGFGMSVPGRGLAGIGAWGWAAGISASR